jgi:drug/metabolite transporter (DMT)-like permease
MVKNRDTLPKWSTSMGIFFGIITAIAQGCQSIVNNLRPLEMDSLFFSWITACFELVFLLPPLLLSYYKRKPNKLSEDLRENFKNPFTKQQIMVRIVVSGLIFAGCAYYLIVGFTLVDSVTGILAIKTQPISMLVIGAIFLKEKLSGREIFIGLLMFLLIIFLATEGTFMIGNFSIGIIYLLIVPIFWNIGHSMVKPLLNYKILTVPEYVFIRISFTAGILGVVFFIVGDKNQLNSMWVPNAIVSIVLMSILLATANICWYQAVRALPLSFATFIVIPSPVITAFLAYLITQEPLFSYHYIGIIGEIVCLSLLIQTKKNNKQIDNERF